MKKFLRLFLLLAFIQSVILVREASGDPPPEPPPPPGGHGGTGNATPAAAPIDGGLGVLFLLGAAFGGKKLYKSMTGGHGKG